MAPDIRSGRRKTMSISLGKGQEEQAQSSDQQQQQNGAPQPETEAEAEAKAEAEAEAEPHSFSDGQGHGYEDVACDFDPCIFHHMEQHLPSHVLSQPREARLRFMQHLLSKYSSRPDRNRILWQKEYRERICNEYKPLHKELYRLSPDQIFVPSFLDAINANSKDSFQQILTEEAPGLFTFDMFQQGFCESLIEEVEHFEKWVDTTDLHIVRPNTMNKYGVVLDDFGFESMLNDLMLNYVRPLASGLFSDFGSATLDSHHGFIVQYSNEKDLDLGFHVDDSEVTLNVCLGKQFTGGDLFFRGVRCDKHVNSDAYNEEIFEYSHATGKAILHAGRHRHGVKKISSGYRMNMILWCRSAVFREVKKHQRNFFRWCGECVHKQKEQQQQLFETKMPGF